MNTLDIEDLEGRLFPSIDDTTHDEVGWMFHGDVTDS